MKKKILALTVIAMMAFATGCGSSGDSDNTTTTQKASENTIPKYYVSVGNEKVYIGQAGDAAIDALGEANSTFTAVSCAFEGEDKMYMYDGFQVTISTVEGSEVVTAIDFTDDRIATPEGVKIGSTDAQVCSAMGVDSESLGNYTFNDGKTQLTIAQKDGEVIAITYSYK
ncbi:MAG: hypothetical protein GX225_01405 [Clostridiales bacterium]|nr:hypothetical protein [Clostridiales bacterium]